MFQLLARIFHELPSRDREDGRATWQLVPRDWFRGVPERYVAGVDTRGRQEGRPYPWSQQVIHEISGLDHIIHETVSRDRKDGRAKRFERRYFLCE